MLDGAVEGRMGRPGDEFGFLASIQARQGAGTWLVLQEEAVILSWVATAVPLSCVSFCCLTSLPAYSVPLESIHGQDFFGQGLC